MEKGADDSALYEGDIQYEIQTFGGRRVGERIERINTKERVVTDSICVVISGPCGPNDQSFSAFINNREYRTTEKFDSDSLRLEYHPLWYSTTDVGTGRYQIVRKMLFILHGLDRATH
jgi:hypothetical protein